MTYVYIAYFLRFYGSPCIKDCKCFDINMIFNGWPHIYYLPILCIFRYSPAVSRTVKMFGCSVRQPPGDALGAPGLLQATGGARDGILQTARQTCKTNHAQTQSRETQVC